MEKLELKYTTVRNGKWYSHCGKQYVSSSKYEIRDYDIIQKFHFWVFIPKRMESRNSDTCMSMFIAALFTKAQRSKQLKHPSVDEWVNKMWSTHAMQYFSVLRWKEILMHAATWMNLEDMMLCEIS